MGGEGNYCIMSEIWVVSDTHFGHSNIIKYCDRPFPDAAFMDEYIIEQWNSMIKPQDKVYHLGDVYFAQGHTALPKLNGKKRLILGNHDNGKDPRLVGAFKKIEVWRMFPEFGLLLTHVPVHPSTLGERRENGYRRLKNIHGHTHTNAEPDGDTTDYKCVCVELTDYKPVNIEELRIK